MLFNSTFWNCSYLQLINPFLFLHLIFVPWKSTLIWEHWKTSENRNSRDFGFHHSLLVYVAYNRVHLISPYSWYFCVYTPRWKFYRKHTVSFYGVSLDLLFSCVCCWNITFSACIAHSREERLIGDFRCLNIMLEKRGGITKTLCD